MSAKLPMVELTQRELFYPVPITAVTENILKVTNKDRQRISFKLRTNSKKAFVVRPASGFLNPGEEVMIKFILSPQAALLPTPSESTVASPTNGASSGGEDFFLMQVRFVSAEETNATPQEFWAAAATAPHGTTLRISMPCKYISQSAIPRSMVIRNQSGSRGSSAHSHRRTPREQQQDSGSGSGSNTASPSLAASPLNLTPKVTPATAPLAQTPTPTNNSSATCSPAAAPLPLLAGEAHEASSGGGGVVGGGMMHRRGSSRKDDANSAAEGSSTTTAATAVAAPTKKEEKEEQQKGGGNALVALISYRIPVPVVVVLMLLAYSFALFGGRSGGRSAALPTTAE